MIPKLRLPSDETKHRLARREKYNHQVFTSSCTLQSAVPPLPLVTQRVSRSTSTNLVRNSWIGYSWIVVGFTIATNERTLSFTDSSFIRQRKNQAVHVTVDYVCWYVLGSPFRRGVPVHHPTLNESKSNAKLQGLASHWDVRANRLA